MLAPALLAAALAAAPPGVDPLPPLPDARLLADAPTFRSGEPVVATHYFYWYRWPDEHFLEPPNRSRTGHRLHFRDHRAVSYASAAWHRRELEDLRAAGIDVALLVYWGTPRQYDHPETAFSVRGIPPLVAALDTLAGDGRGRVPRIGLFYDTTTLRADLAWAEKGRGPVDLRTPEGRELFYCTIRDFYRLVPPRHWACIAGRPLVQLYEGAFAAGQDATALEHVYASFARDFAGRRPLVIGGPSWVFKADLTTGWSSSLAGPLGDGRAVQIGAGYDDSPVPGRSTPARDRAGGAFYGLSWLTALQQRPDLVILETWNEMHEGTSLCETVEDGRFYIDLTRQWTDRFRAGWTPAGADWVRATRDLFAVPQSRAVGREHASRISLALTPLADGRLLEEGLYVVRNWDGLSEAAPTAGVPSLRTRPNTDGARYLYMDVADPYYYDQRGRLSVTFTYYDEGVAPIELQYDSTDATGGLLDRYKPAAVRVVRADSKSWRTATVALEGARAINRQNGGADFRFHSPGVDLALSRVEVTKLPAGYLEP
jgi:hypothetical protein